MAGGYLSGAMRGRGATPPDEGMDTGEWVDRAQTYHEQLPPRGRELFERSYAPGVRAVSKSREMRGLDDDDEGGGAMDRAMRLLESMRVQARAAGVDPSDDNAVLDWAARHDPTDSTLEAIDLIRRQMRGTGRGDGAWAPGRR